MPVTTVVGSDSEDGFWGSCTSDIKFWNEAAVQVDSVSNSPVSSSKDRSSHIRDAYQLVQRRNISSTPTPSKKVRRNRNAKGSKGKARMKNESIDMSEDDSEEISKTLSTDSESSSSTSLIFFPRSTAESMTSIDSMSVSSSKTRGLLESRSSSLMSIESSTSSGSSSAGRKRSTASHNLPPPSPKIQKTEYSSKSRLQPSPAYYPSAHLPKKVDDVFVVSDSESNPDPAFLSPSTSADVIYSIPKLSITDRTPMTPKTTMSRTNLTPVFERFAIGRSEVAPKTTQNIIRWKPSSRVLEPVIIAHCRKAQALMDAKRISWGAQYELARGVSKGTWTWDDVTAKIAEFTGSNAQSAYKVASVMKARGSIPKAPDLAIWEELDREDAAIIENKSRGLGLLGEWMNEPDWYGGKVQQIARLVQDSKSFKVYLEPMEKRRSHRIARFLGSRRVIQLRVPDNLLRNADSDVNNFCSQKFILCGRVFVPIHGKDNGFYMVETNENWERDSDFARGDQHRLTFDEIIAWHNPLQFNQAQTISKWSTRWALGLSNSRPVIEFRPENIIYIPDIIAEGFDPSKGKPPSDRIMTDGCGFINQAGLLEITRKLYDSRPTAIQGRIAGAKGLWVLHPSDEDPEPKIWIRDSQKKIELPTLDPAHCIFDLLSASHSSSSCSLSAQSIINLSENGVPDSVLVDLMIKGLEAEIKPLLKWSGPHSGVLLWDAINKTGHVSGARVMRFAQGNGRVLGFQTRDWNNNRVDEDAIDDQEADLIVDAKSPAYAYSGRNDFSGGPLTVHESALELLQAGFHPTKSQLLWSKLHSIVTLAIQSSITKFRIPVTESVEALVIPDPLDILEENEIFYRSSQPILHSETQTYFNILTGSVIVGRYPIRLASDMQKMVAVDYPDLHRWADVIIVSTKGRYSPTSLLSGGDCDGDILFMIWSLPIVENFQNQPLIPQPEGFIEKYFTLEKESVAEFCKRLEASPPSAAQKEFQKKLLLGLSDTKVGMYSNFHDLSVWANGYSHRDTIRLAYMFNTLLDASKTGYHLAEKVFRQDSSSYSGGKPPCLRMGNEDSGNSLPARRNTLLGSFILDTLCSAGEKQKKNLLKYYDGLSPKLVHSADEPRDDDLLEPYRKLKGMSQELDVLKQDLDLIEAHVKSMQAEWLQHYSCSQRGPSKKKKGRGEAKATDDLFFQIIRRFAEPIVGVRLIYNIDEVKASYAYHFGKPSFAFSVAFRDLCLIKSRATPGGIAPSIRIFDEAKTISSSARKTFVVEDEVTGISNQR